MTVLQGTELRNYLEKLIDIYSGEIIGNGSSGPSKSNSLMVDILEAEKGFLFDSSDDAKLNFDLNGLPSIESLSQDLIAMREWDDYKDVGDNYDENLENKIESKYKKTASEEFDEKVKSYGSEVNVKSHFTLDKNDKFLRLKTVEQYFVNGIDENSKNTPIAKKEIITDYQVAWNNLFSETKSSYHLLDIETQIATQKNDVEEYPFKINDKISNELDTAKYMGKNLVNFLKVASKGSFMVASDLIKLHFFQFSYYKKSYIKEYDETARDAVGILGKAITTVVSGAVAYDSNLLLEYLALDFSTNALSCLYEWRNHAKNKVKQIKEKN